MADSVAVGSKAGSRALPLAGDAGAECDCALMLPSSMSTNPRRLGE